MKQRKEIIIIPAYNEEASLAAVLQRIRNTYNEADILVVNDGSSDQTGAIAQKEADTTINLPFNAGYGTALQTGFKYAYRHKYDYVISMDADGQHDPQCIPQLLKELESGAYDLIIGSRFLGSSSFKMPFLKSIGLFFFRLAVLFHTGQKITDPTSGYQALNRRILKFYTTHFYPIDYPDADLLIMVHMAGFKFKEVPVIMHPNPKIKGMHHGILIPVYYVFKMVLSIFTALLRRKEAYEQSE
jgi:glycosyltransferase involved in cell wall biosynthesis